MQILIFFIFFQMYFFSGLSFFPSLPHNKLGRPLQSFFLFSNLFFAFLFQGFQFWGYLKSPDHIEKTYQFFGFAPVKDLFTFAGDANINGTGTCCTCTTNVAATTVCTSCISGEYLSLNTVDCVATGKCDPYCLFLLLQTVNICIYLFIKACESLVNYRTALLILFHAPQIGRKSSSLYVLVLLHCYNHFYLHFNSLVQNVTPLNVSKLMYLPVFLLFA